MAHVDVWSLQRFFGIIIVTFILIMTRINAIYYVLESALECIPLQNQTTVNMFLNYFPTCFRQNVEKVLRWERDYKEKSVRRKLDWAKSLSDKMRDSFWRCGNRPMLYRIFVLESNWMIPNLPSSATSKFLPTTKIPSKTAGLFSNRKIIPIYHKIKAFLSVTLSNFRNTKIFDQIQFHMMQHFQSDIAYLLFATSIIIKLTRYSSHIRRSNNGLTQ